MKKILLFLLCSVTILSAQNRKLWVDSLFVRGSSGDYRKVELAKTFGDTSLTGLDSVGVYKHVVNNRIYNVLDYGAVGDAITDDTDAIQEAIDSATVYNEIILGNNTWTSYALVKAVGKFKISSTINITCDVDMKNAIFYVDTTFADTAVVVGPSIKSNYLRLNNTYLPSVRVADTDLDWSYNNYGIVMYNLNDSRIFMGEVYGFRNGVLITTKGNKGFAYNDLHLKSIRNSKYGLTLKREGSGWTNENNFFGGRIRIDTEYDSTGILLRLEGDNNVFHKLCLEGNNDSLKIYLNGTDFGCSYNYFYGLRPEVTDGKWNLYVDSAKVRWNGIHGGYISDFATSVNYITNGPVSKEAVNYILPREFTRAGNNTNGIVKLQNTNSDGNPIISLYSLYKDYRVDPGDYTSYISSTGFGFKSSYTYNNYYLYADPIVKGLRIGSANLSTTSAPYFAAAYLNNEWNLTINSSPFRTMNGLYIGDVTTTEIDSAKISGNNMQIWSNGVNYNASSIAVEDTLPTSGNYSQGYIIFQSTPDSGQSLGWVCTQSGTFGTLTGVTATFSGQVTGTIPVNDASGLSVGEYITIAGRRESEDDNYYPNRIISIDTVGADTIKVSPPVFMNVANPVDSTVSYVSPAFLTFGQAGIRQSGSTPHKRVKPNFIGEEYYNTADSSFYKAVSVKDSVWKKITK